MTTNVISIRCGNDVVSYSRSHTATYTFNGTEICQKEADEILTRWRSEGREFTYVESSTV